jgi:xanthosine utilization system XapX-like protein
MKHVVEEIVGEMPSQQATTETTEHQEQEDQEQEIVEEMFLKRPSMWVWLLAFGALILSIAFPVLGVYTTVFPVMAIFVLIGYSLALGLISWTWSLVIAVFVSIFSFFYLTGKMVKHEYRDQISRIDAAYPQPKTGWFK